MTAGCGNVHYEVLYILLSPPDVISSIKPRMVGEGACSAL